MEMAKDGDAYYLAIAGVNTDLLAVAKDLGNGFLYQESYSQDRSAVLSACQAHQSLLLRLLRIKQVPDLVQIEKAIRRFYAPIGREYMYIYIYTYWAESFKRIVQGVSSTFQRPTFLDL